MNGDIYRTLQAYLERSAVRYELIDHEPVDTTAEACDVVGHRPHESTKSLVLTTETVMVVATVPATEEVDFARVRETTETRGLEMCPPAELESRYGLSPGGVPPFGYDGDTEIAVSTALFENDDVYFSPGRRDRSVRVSGDDFRKMVSDWGGRIME